MYQALLFSPPAPSCAEKSGTGNEATLIAILQLSVHACSPLQFIGQGQGRRNGGKTCNGHYPTAVSTTLPRYVEKYQPEFMIGESAFRSKTYTAIAIQAIVVPTALIKYIHLWLRPVLAF